MKLWKVEIQELGLSTMSSSSTGEIFYSCLPQVSSCSSPKYTPFLSKDSL
ncbi:unnamed protein product [Moneuplotes crassus]|uniref:Uncharacterized protein n=1 Tax=Euplotes crassus TaxID=5936 RepID=A0AAD1UM03_EUPCR|nr:unnamed protein product [Moneuplotes crassus]